MGTDKNTLHEAWVIYAFTKHMHKIASDMLKKAKTNPFCSPHDWDEVSSIKDYTYRCLLNAKDAYEKARQDNQNGQQ